MIAFFQQDEEYAIKNQGNRNYGWGVKVLGNPVVDQQTDNTNRQNRNDNLKPELEGGKAFCSRFCPREWV